jgi:hypothetical protein
MATEQDVKDAIRCILCDEKSYKTSLNYAIGYCTLALRMTGDALKVQCLYILNNITHWRGTGAKEVRFILKQFAKGE